jgi:hypothetical protein
VFKSYFAAAFYCFCCPLSIQCLQALALPIVMEAIPNKGPGEETEAGGEEETAIGTETVVGPITATTLIALAHAIINISPIPVTTQLAIAMEIKTKTHLLTPTMIQSQEQASISRSKNSKDKRVRTKTFMYLISGENLLIPINFRLLRHDYYL